MVDDFPKRLKYFRSLKNLSQAELAKMVGISTKQISDYEVGTTSKPRQSTFIKLLNALGVTESEFITTDCVLGKREQDTNSNSLMPMAVILSSPLRGRLLTITGMTMMFPYKSERTIHIYSGTITRTSESRDDYVHVYYLSGDTENTIFVHKDNIGPILECLKEENAKSLKNQS